MFGTVAVLVAALTLGQNEPWLIPYQGDEVALVRVMANPEEYVGKSFIICGGLQINDNYIFSYSDAKDTHYSLLLRAVGKDSVSPGKELAYLYLSKDIGRAIVDVIAGFQAETLHGAKVARARVTLVPRFFAKDKRWNYMEVLDIQFIGADHKGWGPWMAGKQQVVEKKNVQPRAAKPSPYLSQTERQIALLAKKRGIAITVPEIQYYAAFRDGKEPTPELKAIVKQIQDNRVAEWKRQREEARKDAEAFRRDQAERASMPDTVINYGDPLKPQPNEVRPRIDGGFDIFDGKGYRRYESPRP